jgi:uncharacterized protein with HEPN domain
MSERTDKDLLNDIQEAAHRIAAYIAAMPYEAFLGDTKTQDAVVRNLEIIGEATKNLSAELRAKYPDIPWRSMAGVRDRLIHDYFGVNLDIVWHIVTVELPDVASRIEEILRDERA